MTRYSLFILFALIGFAPFISSAQVSKRDVVRVTIVGGREVVGRVSEVSDIGLKIFSSEGFTENISFDKIESLHLRKLSRANVRTGAVAGLITGAGIGGFLGFIGGGILGAEDCDGCSSFDVVDGIVGASVGAFFVTLPFIIVGAIIGLLFQRRVSWQEVSLMEMGSVSIVPRIDIRANSHPALGVQLVF